MLVFISAIFSGLVYVVLSKIGKTEHPVVVVNYFMAVSVIVGGVLSIGKWVNPIGIEWILLIGLGVFGYFGQVYMTKAFQEASSTSQIAPLKYLETIFTLLLGVFIFAEVYTFWSLLGIGLIIIGLVLNAKYKEKAKYNMSFKKLINHFRSRTMEGLTKNVGKSFTNPDMKLTDASQIKRILISRPNHKLGNHLLLTPLVQELINTFPDCKIDLFVKGGVACTVFENYEQVDKIIQLPRKPFNNLLKYGLTWLKLKKTKYDLVINGDKNSSSGRLSTQFARAPFKIFGDVNEDIQNIYEDHKHISKYPIYNLRHYLELLGLPKNNKPLPLMDIKLSEKEISRGKKILDKLVKNDKETICIYTNATGDKCYSEDWWEAFYHKLQKDYPDYNIIELLPIENISKINFKAPNFYSNDVREMGGVLRNTTIFIAADNGIMHLASASLVPTVGFFSVTEEAIYGPYGNGSIAVNTNYTTINDWFKSLDNILS